MNQFGYCCINTTLQKHDIRSNRSMKRKSFDQFGIAGASSLALQNVKDLLKIVLWNSKHNINVFRITSDLFPWASEYNIQDMPDIEKISLYMEAVGIAAKNSKQRLSFHPGQYNCLASSDEKIIKNCITDLSIHGIQMDMFNMPRDPSAKINIHVGASYGNRESSLEQWCKNFDLLPDSVKTRLTVENDDRPNLYSTKMLYDNVYKRVGIPIVFDSHHFECGPQDVSYEESFLMAAESWKNIRQMCHHSCSKKLYEDASCKVFLAHSDYIYKDFNSCGLSVDVALEAKAKEYAVFDFIKKFKHDI